MIALRRVVAVGLAVVLGIAVLGCASRPGGVIQESGEFTFDDIAAAAAAETAESENARQ